MSTRVLTTLLSALLTLGLFSSTVYAGPDFGGRERSEFEGKNRQGGGLQRLHEELNLSEKQEQDWKSFMEQHKQERPERPDPAELEKMSAPERMEKHAEMLMERAKEAKDRAKVVAKFYNTLSKDQQRTFDAFFDRMLQHRMDRRGGPDGDMPERGRMPERDR